MMSTKPAILVIGATGIQGGSVASALLKCGRYSVKALTRNKSSAKAQELANAGAEVIVGNLENKDSLVAAMKGVSGVFMVTNFWELKDNPMEAEIMQGKNFADAAKTCGVKHVIFSTLESVESLTNGRIKVPFFDGKARIAQYMHQVGLPVTEVILAMYCENFVGYMKPKKASDGVYEIKMPIGDKPIDLIDVGHDLGQIVLNILDHREEWIGKNLRVTSEALTGVQIAEVVTKVTGKQTRFVPIPVEEYKKLPLLHSEEIGDMFQFFQEFAGKLGDAQRCKEIDPEMHSFEAYVKEHGHQMIA